MQRGSPYLEKLGKEASPFRLARHIAYGKGLNENETGKTKNANRSSRKTSMSEKISRRRLMQVAGAGLAMSAVPGGEIANATAIQNSRATTPNNAVNDMRFCLNTSTIREQGLGLQAEVELAAKVGYDGIEPWIREISAFQDQGGSLADLAKQMNDLGLKVENAIGFARWIVDDDEERAKGLEQAKREMDLVRQLGGSRIAAPPVGATGIENFDLFKAAERYGKLLEVGREIGVTPQLELWGFSKTLSRLGELAFVAAECGQPDAAVLPDVYHIFKGGSEFHGLRLIEADLIDVFHFNDYPASPPREEMKDADRVYPGDGVAPLDAIFGELMQRGFSGALSLELFNPDYWKQDAELVARTGLEKMKEAIDKARTWQPA